MNKHLHLHTDKMLRTTKYIYLQAITLVLITIALESYHMHLNKVMGSIIALVLFLNATHFSHRSGLVTNSVTGKHPNSRLALLITDSLFMMLTWYSVGICLDMVLGLSTLLTLIIVLLTYYLCVTVFYTNGLITSVQIANDCITMRNTMNESFSKLTDRESREDFKNKLKDVPTIKVYPFIYPISVEYILFVDSNEDIEVSPMF